MRRIRLSAFRAVDESNKVDNEEQDRKRKDQTDRRRAHGFGGEFFICPVSTGENGNDA